MSFRDILGSWATWSKLSSHSDDDWIDRLNHIYTVLMLVVFALFVASGTYVQDPISCYTTNELSAARVKYINNYCWIRNTYYVPFHEDLSRDHEKNIQLELTYYQYVPLILLFMAFLFKIPSVIWRALSGFCGIDLEKIVEMTASAHYVDDNKRTEKVAGIAECIDRWLESNRQYHWNMLVRLRQKASRICLCLNRREGTYLVGLYLLVKILFAANVVAQFFLLDTFLDGFFSLWGIEAINSLAWEHRMKESRRFPRVTMCDFRIRQLQNVHKYTVQCVLPLNLFNEKIFLFLWFWFIIVAVVTCLSLLTWVWRTFIRRNRLVVVKKYLKLKSRIRSETDKKILKKFASFLRDDGIFLIRMIGKNSNDILVTDIVNKLWDIYLEKPMIKKLVTNNEETGNGNAHYM